MMSKYIQGWRVVITDHPGRQELEIQGPGELHIVIRKFKTADFYLDNSIGYQDDGTFQEYLCCTYIRPGGTSLYEEDIWSKIVTSTWKFSIWENLPMHICTSVVPTGLSR